MIGGIILLMLVLQLIREFKKEFLEHLPDSKVFRWITCVLIGVSTMLANAAGPVIQLYLLSRRLPKMEMIGIGARFFLLINIIKVPINGQLNLITSETLMENLKLAPGIVAGIYIGKWMLLKVPQRAFEWMILGFAAMAAVRMLFW